MFYGSGGVSFVMKAHVNNSYIRKIHNNTTLIVRNVFVFYLKNNYCFFGKKIFGDPGAVS